MNGESPLNFMASEVNRISTAHGFWPEGGRNFGEMLMLATSELVEAMEEDREGKPDVYYNLHIPSDPEGFNGLDPRVQAVVGKMANGINIDDDDKDTLIEEGFAKPEGVAVELVDALIRILDTLYNRGVDIDSIFWQKMNYNSKRPHKHGKAY
jgi:hypothetical protein